MITTGGTSMKYSAIMKQLTEIYFPEFSNFNFVIVKNDEVENNLLEFEKNTRFTKYKFGVLYISPGQLDENEMFSNGSSFFLFFFFFLFIFI